MPDARQLVSVRRNVAYLRARILTTSSPFVRAILQGWLAEYLALNTRIIERTWTR
jgi:hypothetical protein